MRVRVRVRVLVRVRVRVRVRTNPAHEAVGRLLHARTRCESDRELHQARLRMRIAAWHDAEQRGLRRAPRRLALTARHDQH